MNAARKWTVSGGKVTSRSDGQRHYVSAGQVAKLHGLADHQWTRWVYDRDNEPDLFPRYDGEYRDLSSATPPLDSEHFR